MEKITKSLIVEVAKDIAFEKFLKGINEWWPKEYTWSQDKLKEIRIEPEKDGLCTEIGPYGFRCDWGRVTALTKNELIALKWQISPQREPVPNPDHGSDIKIQFKANGPASTLVEFEHSNFENHGKGAKEYLQMMDGEQGWDFILHKFRTYLERGRNK